MYLEQLALEEKYSHLHLHKELSNYFMNLESKEFTLLVDVLIEYMSIEEPEKSIQIEKNKVQTYWYENCITMHDVLSEFIIAISTVNRPTINDVLNKVVRITGQSKDNFGYGIYLCTQLLSVLCASPYFTLEEPTRSGLRFVRSNLTLPDYFYNRIATCAYLPPALIPVKPINNGNAGWLSVTKSIFLNTNHHNGNAPLHWLDSLNSVAFSIDLNMLNYDEEMIDCDTSRKKRAFKQRRDLTIRNIKEMLAHGNKFYFIHRFCARYRAYASGYVLSPQGNDYRKALLNLHTEEKLTDEYHF